MRNNSNVPAPIGGDETLLPGGQRLVQTPPDAWQPKVADDGVAWYAGAMALVFFLGFFTALVAVGAANRFAGWLPTIVQPALLDPPAIIVQPLALPDAAAVANGACIPSMEPCQ